MKTIKENINSKEFKQLIIYTRGREDLRRNTKSNLLRTFVFLYYTGARINELQTLKIKDVKQVVEFTQLLYLNGRIVENYFKKLGLSDLVCCKVVFRGVNILSIFIIIIS